MINIDTLNDVLSDQLLNRLLIPLYVYSLTKRKKLEARQVVIIIFLIPSEMNFNLEEFSL